VSDVWTYRPFLLSKNLKLLCESAHFIVWFSFEKQKQIQISEIKYLPLGDSYITAINLELLTYRNHIDSKPFCF
jgi:hypothetical protein